jgi:two-component system, OmpR family, KDP operon response regulator KdpE
MRDEPQMNLSLHTYINKKTLHKTRVLLIENGMHENETLKITLESRGLQVHSVSYTQQELSEAHTPEPDIIILDAGSQTSDCSEMLQAIRKISPVPLLVLSAFDQPNIIAQTLDCGADDFLTKPVSVDVLMASINKLTRRARSNKKHEIPGA